MSTRAANRTCVDLGAACTFEQTLAGKTAKWQSSEVLPYSGIEALSVNVSNIEALSVNVSNIEALKSEIRTVWLLEFLGTTHLALKERACRIFGGGHGNPGNLNAQWALLPPTKRMNLVDRVFFKAVFFGKGVIHVFILFFIYIDSGNG